jgi:hypothetical protein
VHLSTVEAQGDPRGVLCNLAHWRREAHTFAERTREVLCDLLRAADHSILLRTTRCIDVRCEPAAGAKVVRKPQRRQGFGFGAKNRAYGDIEQCTRGVRLRDAVAPRGHRFVIHGDCACVVEAGKRATCVFDAHHAQRHLGEVERREPRNRAFVATEACAVIEHFGALTPGAKGLNAKTLAERRHAMLRGAEPLATEIKRHSFVGAREGATSDAVACFEHEHIEFVPHEF